MRDWSAVMGYRVRSSGLASAASVLVVLALLSALHLAPASGQDLPAPEALQITFLANEGFLIRNGDAVVIIDAFVKDEYSGYAALSQEAYQSLVTAGKPFDEVDVALTSHVHLDHFQAPVAEAFLRARPQSFFVASEEVIMALRHQVGASDIQKQLIPVWPETGQTKTITPAGIRIEAFPLRHTNPRNYNIQNLGLLIHVGEKTVLHVGDAEAREENFAPFELAKKQIDVAILPFWLFDQPELVTRQIGARHAIAAHIPVNQTAAMKKRFARQHPDVGVPEQSMQSWTWSDE